MGNCFNGQLFSAIFLETFSFLYKPGSGRIVFQNRVFLFPKVKILMRILSVWYWSTASVKIFLKLTDVSISGFVSWRGENPLHWCFYIDQTSGKSDVTGVTA